MQNWKKLQWKKKQQYSYYELKKLQCLQNWKKLQWKIKKVKKRTKINAIFDINEIKQIQICYKRKNSTNAKIFNSRVWCSKKNW